MMEHHPRSLALVTGGTGVIGPTLVSRLITDGWAVRVLARQVPPTGLFPGSVDVVLGDINDASVVREAASGATHVFHLAAKLHINNPSSSLADQYRRTNVDGTRVIAEAALTGGVSRLVFFSTIAVYGPSAAGEVLHEDSPALASSLYASTKREAEQVVLAMRRSADEPLGVVLRIAGVYGSRIKGNYRELVRWLHRGLFVPVGRGDNRRTLVYERDVADAAVLAATHPLAAGRIFNVTDGQVHTFRDVVAVICATLKRQPPRVHMPLRLARTCAGILDGGLVLAGRRRTAAPLIEKLTEDMAVSGQRIQDELGFHPRFELSEGWAETMPRLIYD
jgi:nucleoside-diphosphate-sugar epimerase